MKKIISLFKRDYEGTRLVFDEVVEGAEWVAAGEGLATRKFNGSACMVEDGVLYKRFDRKRNKKTGEFKNAPDGWIACEDDPDQKTGHWPGWLKVDDGKNDKYFVEAMQNWMGPTGHPPVDGTYELCGPKVQGNPEDKSKHLLIPHGAKKIDDAPRTFDELKAWFATKDIEGIVWHHPDGRMVKIKKKDFGLPRKPDTEGSSDD